MRDLKVPGAALLALISLALMMLPMPRWIIDLLFTFNIATGLIVLLAALKAEKPLDFSVFPPVLLLATLLRLSLNVASTRLILSQGHSGADAAGKVIEAFGKFLLGGNFIIGLLVFAILLIINFLVITKGAGRIAEVSARFALDSLPGKQMAVDADLSAGLIGEEEAKERREEVAREADFYGSMDGASKFVRGDALAAMLIFFLGAIGGVVIGVVSHGLGAGDAASAYLPLAIGDAIASQVPALLLSIASAVIVSKAGSRGNLSLTMLKQFGQEGPVRQAALALGILGILPSMPHVPFLMFAAGLWFLSGAAKKKEQEEAKAMAASQSETQNKEPSPPQELSWDELGGEEPVALEIGYRLIPLADPAQGGDFLAKARALRRKFAENFGFLPPPLRVRDNLELPPGMARLLMRGSVVAEGEFYPDRLLCLREGAGSGWPVAGIETIDPAFGLPALWIEPSQEPIARAMGLAVIQPSAALATLFSKALADHAKQLLGMEELKGLLTWKFKDQKTVSEWVPAQIGFSLLLKVCKELLEEGVPLKDFETMLAEICLGVKKTEDPSMLAELARASVAQNVAQEAFGGREGSAWILDAELEAMLSQSLAAQGGGIEPNLAKHLVTQVQMKSKEAEAMGNRLVLVVAEKIRLPLSKLLRRSVGDLRVLSFAEVPDSWKVQIAGSIR